jgi:DNA-3-methyladenine glycosylase I
MPASYDNAVATAPTCAAAPKSAGAGDVARPAAAAPCLLPPTPAKAASARVAAASVGAEKSRKAPKKAGAVLPVVTFAALEAFEVAGPAGSIAAAQREHVTQAQAQRKSRIAHYGRTASFSRVEGRVGATATATAASAAAPVAAALDEKRCSFITAYSDPVYVAYHDEEWGLPVHDDE